WVWHNSSLGNNLVGIAQIALLNALPLLQIKFRQITVEQEAGGSRQSGWSSKCNVGIQQMVAFTLYLEQRLHTMSRNRHPIVGRGNVCRRHDELHDQQHKLLTNMEDAVQSHQ